MRAQVNAAGVMPVIFATTLMSLPSGVARFTDLEFMENLAGLLYPSSPVYLPTYVALIVFFNYYYTFLQLDPKDVSDQLRKQVRAGPLHVPVLTLANLARGYELILTPMRMPPSPRVLPSPTSAPDAPRQSTSPGKCPTSI